MDQKTHPVQILTRYYLGDNSLPKVAALSFDHNHKMVLESTHFPHGASASIFEHLLEFGYQLGLGVAGEKLVSFKPRALHSMGLHIEESDG